MRTVEINESVQAVVTQMRDGAAYGNASELIDGNMIPRLCQFAGEGACAATCQLDALRQRAEVANPSKECAEANIVEALATIDVKPENFAMVAATKDRVGFADSLAALEATRHHDGYSMVPGCNAFFFKPGKDQGVDSLNPLSHVAMRMADCGDVIYTGKDRDGEDFVGIAHFSRTNMRGPSAYIHELNGQKVSWGEYVLGSAVEHYGADPASMRVRLVAAVERDDFVHHYPDTEAMEKHFPGWEELGFMHPARETDFDCLIDYREMIAWQLTESVQNPALVLKSEQVTTVGAINTGDLSLGHASHHAASKGVIAHGRDMYIVGSIAKPDEQ